MPLDLNSTEQSISSKLDAFKTFADVSKSEKGFLGKLANSSSEANSQITSQLDKIKDLMYGVSLTETRNNNIPKEEVVNYFLWRAKDWERNSLQMYCRNFFSDKEMQNKSREDQHELLFSIGKNWTNDLSDIEKNGTFLVNTESGLHSNITTKPNYEDIARLLSTTRGII